MSYLGDPKAKCPDCESFHDPDFMIEAKRGTINHYTGETCIRTTLVCENCASEDEIDADRWGE